MDYNVTVWSSWNHKNPFLSCTASFTSIKWNNISFINSRWTSNIVTCYSVWNKYQKYSSAINKNQGTTCSSSNSPTVDSSATWASTSCLELFWMSSLNDKSEKKFRDEHVSFYWQFRMNTWVRTVPLLKTILSLRGEKISHKRLDEHYAHLHSFSLVIMKKKLCIWPMKFPFDASVLVWYIWMHNQKGEGKKHKNVYE